MTVRRSIQVVLAEEDRPVRLLMEREVTPDGRLLVSVKSGQEAQEWPREEAFDQAMVDLGDLGRVESFLRHGDKDTDSQVLVITPDAGEVRPVSDVLESDGWAFLTKPLNPQEIQQAIAGRASGKAQPAEAGPGRLRELITAAGGRGPILGRSEAMEELLSLVERVSSSQASVLIHGETGSGKGMVARMIHDLSPRSEARMVAINCSAFPEQLLESELFGYEKGAFTGAVDSKPGLFEVADGGTLFLDEVAEMSPAMQAKLLQVLDGGELRRLGGTRPRRVDARILSASNKDLLVEVQEKRFREDLLFRLNVVTLRVPPLRERREEIPELVEGFAERFAGQGLPRRTFSPEVLSRLQAYSWPGNVRELANTVEGLLLLTNSGTVEPEDLPQTLRAGEVGGGPKAVPSPETPDEEPPPLSEVEARHIARTLAYTRGKKAPAARLLGIDVKTLTSKIRNYGLELPS